MSEFTFATIENFDTHIVQSIRGYEDLVCDVVNMSRYFIEPNTSVLDIGCSTGRLLQKIYHDTENYIDSHETVRFIGIDIEPKFIETSKNTLSGCNIKIQKQRIQNFDLPDSISFATSIFTLQFMPRDDRRGVIHDIYEHLNVGGAFIICEKVFSESVIVHDILSSTHHDFKRLSFSDKCIADKGKSLRHMMKPNTRVDLIEDLKSAGFTIHEVFWQQHEFIGAIAIKTNT